MTQPDLFGTAAQPARQPQRADLPLLLAASPDHAIGGALPSSTPAPKFECWYFHGTGDAFFGGDADDRILYTDGTRSAFYGARWQAERDGMRPALFASEAAAIAAGQALAPPGALVSAIIPAGSR